MQGTVHLSIFSYTTHIDTSFPKEDWSGEEEQRMFELHNELGNKWAVIGGRLGGKYLLCYLGLTTR